MKKLFICTILLIFWGNKLFAQHIPPCQGTKHGSSAICYGYAIARAFDRSWNDSECPASTLRLVSADLEEYFNSTTFSYAAVAPGDIISFQNLNHVAYVEHVFAHNANSIWVCQVEGEAGGTEEQYLKLYDVIHGIGCYVARGEPQEIWTKEALWPIIIEN